MSHGAEATVFLMLVLMLLLVPSVLIVFFGWRKTRSIEVPIKKLVLRSFIGSFAVTPSIYGHTGFVLAWWILIFGTWAERLWWGLVPIVAVWAFSFSIGYLQLRMRPQPPASNQLFH